MITVENKRGRGRPRAFDRSVVLERAMQVFWAAGYEGASIPMLTEAMGISAQSLYAAFNSKQALYREAIEVYRTTIGGFAARALDEEPDAIEALSRLLQDAATTFSRTDGTPGCMIVFAPGETVEPELTALGRRLRAESIEKVADRLSLGIREGQLDSDTDCVAWSRYIGTVVQGMSVQARDGATTQALLATAYIAAQSLSALRVRGVSSLAHRGTSQKTRTRSSPTRRRNSGNRRRPS
jgi:AcrR family transcriptional regulator